MNCLTQASPEKAHETHTASKPHSVFKISITSDRGRFSSRYRRSMTGLKSSHRLLRGTPWSEAGSGSADPSILMLGFVQCKALNCKLAAAAKFVGQDPIPCATRCMRGSG